MTLTTEPHSNGNPSLPDGQRVGLEAGHEAGQGLEFPCEIPLKAMGKSGASFKQLVVETVARHVTVDASNVRSRPSKGGKYESITVTVNLESRAQMERIYAELSSHPQVLWTL